MKKWQIKKILYAFSNYFYSNLDRQYGIFSTPKYRALKKLTFEGKNKSEFIIDGLFNVCTNEYFEVFFTFINDTDLDGRPLEIKVFDKFGFVVNEQVLIISGKDFHSLIANINKTIEYFIKT